MATRSDATNMYALTLLRGQIMQRAVENTVEYRYRYEVYGRE